MKLQPGQVAVVTGAASGIGFQLANHLSRRGLGVAMVDIAPEPLAAAADRIEHGGAPVLTAQADVAESAAVHQLRERVLEHFGRVDVLCNNAGVTAGFRPLWQYDRLDWDWLLRVNLTGVINGVSAFVPDLVAQGQGHVLNTASLAGLATDCLNGAYGVTKHAVVALSEHLRADLDEYAPDVGVTVICPSVVRTNIAQAVDNRPAALNPGATPPLAAPDRVAQRRVLEASEVATLAVSAIETDRLHLITHPESASRARARIEAVLRDLDSSDEHTE